MKTVTAEEFKNLLSNTHNNPFFKTDIHYQHYPKTQWPINIRIEIQDYIVDGEVTFDSNFTPYTGTLYFINVQFNNGIFFDKSKFNIEFRGGEYQLITFKNCDMTIKILGGNFKNNLIINRGEYNLSISGGNFEKDINIQDGIFKSFSITQTNKSLKLDNKVIIYDGQFTSDVDLDVDCEIYIFSGAFHNNLRILQGNIILQYNNYNLKINQLTIGVQNTLKKININGNYELLNNQENCKINKLKLSGYLSKDSSVFINGPTINEVVFENFINLGNLYFNSIKCLIGQKIDFKSGHLKVTFQKNIDYHTEFVLGRFDFSHHLPSNMVREDFLKTQFLSIENASKLKIFNSDLGKANFTDCDFEKYLLEFKSSKINDIFLAGSKMPRPQNIVVKDLDQKRLVLSQIKKTYDNRGDIIESAQYQTEELNNYLLQLRGGKQQDKAGEYISLMLNYLSNNHGQSWVRSLKGIMLISLIGWLIIYVVLALPHKTIPNLVFLFKNLPYYLQFLNPIRPYDFMNKLSENLFNYSKNKLTSFESIQLSIAQMLDWFFRLIITYLEYQLVAAFRKHGKNK